MPFFKYVFGTDKAEERRARHAAREAKKNSDDSAFENQRLVESMRHMAQLVNIANDVFRAVETELRDIVHRTFKLKTKIQNCQDTVDNLNAKTVKVPRGSLSDERTTLRVKSSSVEKIGSLLFFADFPRSAAVDRLRDLADGPTSPAVIPCGMVASEVDGVNGTLSSSNSSSTSSHISLKPLKETDKFHSTESGESNGEIKDATFKDVASSIVPIDVSGQTFSRMESFRKSLVHVDFLKRLKEKRKKRDKRRNTVAEGNVKDLKDAFQNSISDDSQFTASNGIDTYKLFNAESKNQYNLKNKPNDKSLIEQNNNADYVKSAKSNNHTHSIENQIIHKEKNVLNSENLQKEPKQTDSEAALKQLSSNKRKPKSHIPISTISAAMNVAVEMRQHNGIKKETPDLNTVCNNHNSDSDNKLQENMRYSNSSNNEESSQDESWTDYKKRFQDKHMNLAEKKDYNRNNLTDIETEVSSSASSENINTQDTTATTSAESDAFFISSDESDEEHSEVISFQENCGSSTPVGTASDGSLNSLLSETGTEMTSSTGTLTSIGHDYLLTPPPPPPPMIISATVNDKDLVKEVSNSSCLENNVEVVKNKKNSKIDISQKQSKQLKSLKSQSPKYDFVISAKNSNDAAKNLFNSLVSLKTNAKNKNKKDAEKKKLDKSSHQPAFDMYGNNSPVKTKQVPAFIKENYSPVIQKQEKSHMKSFLASDKSKTFTQVSNNEDSDKYKTELKSPRVSDSNTPDINDIPKTRVFQKLSSIPSKYEHHVTVTPVQRCSNTEQKNIHHKRSVTPEKMHNPQHRHFSQPASKNVENQVLVQQILRPNTPVTLQQHEKTKSAARVVLDYNGKVIYTTNSLDRNPQHHSRQTVNLYNSAQNKIYDPYLKEKQSAYYYDSCQENDFQQKPISSFRLNIPNSQGNISFNERRYNGNYRNSDLDPKKQTYEHENLLHDMKNAHSRVSKNSKMFEPWKIESRPLSYAGSNTLDSYFDDPSNNLLPNPNVSGLPIQESMLTRRNVNLHSKQMEKMNTSSPEYSSRRLSDSFCSTPTSQTSCENMLSKSPQSTMSTEDLFAVIHDCKKRMNIKTDSDISLASSSRSCSPSYLRPNSSRGTLAETGFLSPRSQVHLQTSGDRRSWADFRPVDSVCYERKSLASDRLGPTKPTSMHDFKMLLLQTRSSSQNTGQRKSAVELLKLPLNQNNRITMSPSLPCSPRNSFSSQNSPTLELTLSNGHSTVPFKRGNRVRNSLQSRYVMYPPIFEDCSEDSELCNDVVSNKSNIENVSEKEHTDNKHTRNIDNGSMQNHQGYFCDNTINAQVKQQI